MKSYKTKFAMIQINVIRPGPVKPVPEPLPPDDELSLLFGAARASLMFCIGWSVMPFTDSSRMN